MKVKAGLVPSEDWGVQSVPRLSQVAGALLTTFVVPCLVLWWSPHSMFSSSQGVTLYGGLCSHFPFFRKTLGILDRVLCYSGMTLSFLIISAKTVSKEGHNIED